MVQFLYLVGFKLFVDLSFTKPPFWTNSLRLVLKTVCFKNIINTNVCGNKKTTLRQTLQIIVHHISITKIKSYISNV